MRQRAPSLTLEPRLVNTLLDSGERTSVADYLERTAASTPDGGVQRLADASAIRNGGMPVAYQAFKAAP